MPSPFAWEDDEDQDYPSFGSNRPARRSSAMTSFSVPRPISGEYGHPGFASAQPGSAPEPSFPSKPRTALEDLAAHQSSMPQREKPKWWQRLAAGALGGAAGYLNAGGRNHVNVEPAIAGIYAGDYPRQMGNWQNEQSGLTTRAKIEAEQADDARRTAAAQSQEALRNEQIATQKRMQAREDRLANVPPPPIRGVNLSPGGRLTHPVTGATLAENPPLPQRPVPQIPGRDIPYPPEVEKQRGRMRPPRLGPAGGKVTVTDKKFEIAQAANQAISEHPELDLLIIKENVMNPRYFTDWEPQKRADVSLEIQRRIDDKNKARPTGVLGRGKSQAAQDGIPARNAGAGKAPKALTDPQKAADYLNRAGGDKEKARALARADGWTF